MGHSHALIQADFRCACDAAVVASRSHLARGVNRRELQRLAKDRSADASALLQAGRYAGAFYLAGYAIECGLKACIARQVRRHEFPDKRTVIDSHSPDLQVLVKTAGLSLAIAAELSSSAAFASHWAVVTNWKSESRYQVHVSVAEATNMVAAVNARKDGVLAWLKKRW